MTFQGAKLNQHGLRCAVAIVKRDAVIDDVEGDRLIALLQNQVFPHSPVVLMAHDPRLGPIYYGRADLVRYLEHVDVSQIQWVKYTVASSASHPSLAKQRAAFLGPQPAKKGKAVSHSSLT